MTKDDLRVNPRTVRPRRAVPPPTAAVELTDSGIPVHERDFFIEEFRGVTIVIALPVMTAAALTAVARTIGEFRPDDTRLVLVVPDDCVSTATTAIGVLAVENSAPWNHDVAAELGLAIADRPGRRLGSPPRSFADIDVHRDRLASHLTDGASTSSPPPRSRRCRVAHTASTSVVQRISSSSRSLSTVEDRC